MKTAAPMAWDVQRVRRDFPILTQKVRGRPLVYLDNAATTQKPRSVIETIRHYYERDNANIHRGVHLLSERATDLYESARRTVQNFLGAHDESEIIFVRGATEAINLVATSWGSVHLKAGDEVLISLMEHHANIVPWQMICERTGACLKAVPVSAQGTFLLDEYRRLLTDRTRIVAVTHVSNVLGTVNPVKEIVRLAKEKGAAVLIDGAQAVPHQKVNVQELGCDFYVFSGHKIYGPTGIGVLYGRKELLEKMPPYQGGGDMIRTVSIEKTTYNGIPYRFEAGTPHIAGAIGLAAALDYLGGIGLENIESYERELLVYATQTLSSVPDLKIIGAAPHKAAVVSFELGSIHPHDIGTILDQEGIAIRTGHHCAMPLMECLGLVATARASFCFYNTREEIDALAAGLKKVREVFA